jgi:hypothetical protein
VTSFFDAMEPAAASTAPHATVEVYSPDGSRGGESGALESEAALHQGYSSLQV